MYLQACSLINRGVASLSQHSCPGSTLSLKPTDFSDTFLGRPTDAQLVANLKREF